ncbi:MAG: hypothetical protein QMD36_02430 [Candidatus Aenigmarchaeota archaeon]|nr:hypothetical protein [Candidatus Aenigmarchaeota archaeon]
MTEVQLVNFDIFDEFTINKIKEVTQPLLTKFKKFFGRESLLDFKLIVDKIHEDVGGKTMYEVIGTLDTTLGKFRTTENGLEILNVVDEIVKELTRLVTEKKEMKKAKRTLPANA